MKPNEQGAYCFQCEKNVIDFTNKSNEEIKRILLKKAGTDLCGRLTIQQEAELNAEFEAWSFRSTKSFQSAFLFTLIAVFGLGLFSCSEQKQEQEIVDFQKTVQSIVTNIHSEGNLKPEVEEEEVIPPTPPQLIDEVFEPVVIETFILEEIPVVIREIDQERNVEYTVLGGMSFSRLYADHLTSTVDVEYDENGELIPTEFSSLAFPNPTIDNSTLEIKVPESGRFHIDLYDMNGKHIQKVHSGSIDQGTFREEIEMRDLPTGIYLVLIKSKDYNETIRISKL